MKYLMDGLFILIKLLKIYINSITNVLYSILASLFFVMELIVQN
jgi:hypothetical protein